MEVRSNVGIIREYVRTPRRGRGLGFLPPEKEGFYRGLDQVLLLPSFRACAMRTFPDAAFYSNMEFGSARQAILQLLGAVAPADLPALLEWMRTTRKRPEPEAGGWGKDTWRT